MRVLMTGTEAAGIDEVARRFRAAGHSTASCVDDLNGRTVCTSEDCGASTCPAVAGVDVIVAVRARPVPNLVTRERTVSCVLLLEAPLVVAGSTVLNPFGHRADALAEGVESILEVATDLVARSKAD